MKMAERNKLMENIKAETAETLTTKLSKSEETYKNVLKQLILQSLLKLMEVDIVIRCRKSDLNIVKDILGEVGLTYIQKLKNEVPKLKGKEIHPKLTIDENNFLPELNSKESGLASWY
jgi:vacuolar-type H+-ATPase subunit E/Vma4